MHNVIIISHVFREKRSWKRWQLMVKNHEDIDLTLLAPKHWEEGRSADYTFGKTIKEKGIFIEEDRFRVNLIDMRHIKYFGWVSFDLIEIIKTKKPTLIYHIGHHQQISLTETLILRKLYSPSTKVVAFSMRGLPNDFDRQVDFKRNILNLIEKFKWNYFKKNIDAIMCHYPEAKLQFENEGIHQPIYIQTQIGFDRDLYKFSIEGRNEIRELFNIKDEYVFGSASRFSEDKGIDDILDSLPISGNWKYLILGSGTEYQTKRIQEKVIELSLEEKVIFCGFIEWTELSKYLSALDCFVHAPRTTQKWLETFSLAIVQAMAVGLPVIGNTSGSVPYQIGKDGIIVEEGNIEQLNNALKNAISNPNKYQEIGTLMKERALKCFEIRHLSECFYYSIKDIILNEFDEKKCDMTSFNTESFKNEKIGLSNET